MKAKLGIERKALDVQDQRMRCAVYIDNARGSLSEAKRESGRGGFAAPHAMWLSELNEWLKKKERAMTHKPDEEVPERPSDLHWTELLVEICPHDKKLTKGECIRCHGRIDRKWRKSFKKAQGVLGL
jgi:hypothetical protein